MCWACLFISDSTSARGRVRPRGYVEAFLPKHVRAWEAARVPITQSSATETSPCTSMTVRAVHELYLRALGVAAQRLQLGLTGIGALATAWSLEDHQRAGVVGLTPLRQMQRVEPFAVRQRADLIRPRVRVGRLAGPVGDGPASASLRLAPAIQSKCEVRDRTGLFGGFLQWRWYFVEVERRLSNHDGSTPVETARFVLNPSEQYDILGESKSALARPR